MSVAPCNICREYVDESERLPLGGLCRECFRTERLREATSRKSVKFGYITIGVNLDSEAYYAATPKPHGGYPEGQGSTLERMAAQGWRVIHMQVSASSPNCTNVTFERLATK